MSLARFATKTLGDLWKNCEKVVGNKIKETAKIIREIPLPIPLGETRPPSHINKMVPAVMEATIESKVRGVTVEIICEFFKRIYMPNDWIAVKGTVKYLVY